MPDLIPPPDPIPPLVILTLEQAKALVDHYFHTTPHDPARAEETMHAARYAQNQIWKVDPEW